MKHNQRLLRWEYPCHMSLEDFWSTVICNQHWMHFSMSFIVGHLEKRILLSTYTFFLVLSCILPGSQFKTIVEYAPSQRVPKPWSKKDGREGTIFKGMYVYCYFVKVKYHTQCVYFVSMYSVPSLYFFRGGVFVLVTSCCLLND